MAGRDLRVSFMRAADYKDYWKARILFFGSFLNICSAAFLFLGYLRGIECFFEDVADLSDEFEFLHYESLSTS